MGRPKGRQTTIGRHSLDSSTILTRLRPSSSESLSINSLEARSDGKRYFEKIQPLLLQKMNKEANCKSVIRAMKALALEMTSKFGFNVSDQDTEYLDNRMEDIAMTALAPKVISFRNKVDVRKQGLSHL